MEGKYIRLSRVHLSWIILGIIFLIALAIVLPFFRAIVSAYVLAFLILPLFKFFNRYMNRSLSALLCIFLALMILIVPLFFITKQIVNEVSFLVSNTDLSNLNLLGTGEIASQVQTEIKEYLTQVVGSIVSSLPSILIMILVTFFGLFYFLYDWKKVSSFLYERIPLENKDLLFRDVSKTTKKITYGLLLIGAAEFLVSFIGFSLSGVSFPLIFALIIGLLAFTLVLDPSVVWGPLAIVYFFVFNEPKTALGILITGLILTTDTILRPRIIGSASNINPFIMLLGVLGGIAIFGVFGFIIGPVVLFFAIRLAKESIKIE